jgi:Fe-S-cluster containining protein
MSTFPVAFPPKVQARLRTSDATAQRNVEAASAELRPVIGRLNRMLETVDSRRLHPKAAMRLLRDLASRWAKPLARHSACRKSCAHCCHIPVLISPLEAQVMAEDLKLRAAKPTLALEATHEPGYHDPCVFLRGSSCSIYAHRPLICRVHLNMDADALLCELVEGAGIPVPYANSQQIQMVYAQLGGASGLADIRDFFPQARAHVQGAKKNVPIAGDACSQAQLPVVERPLPRVEVVGVAGTESIDDPAREAHR